MAFFLYHQIVSVVHESVVGTYFLVKILLMKFKTKWCLKRQSLPQCSKIGDSFTMFAKIGLR